MNTQDLHFKALKEWNDSPGLRRQFPTFEFYWHEQYQRVYAMSRKHWFIESFFKRLH